MPQISITTTGTLVLNYNPYRKSIIFHNPSANIMYAQRTDAQSVKAASADLRLPAGATRTLTWIEDGQDAIVDRWSVIVETGTSTLEYAEFSSAELARLEKLFVKEVEQ